MPRFATTSPSPLGTTRSVQKGLVPHRPSWIDLLIHQAEREARKGTKMGANSTQAAGVAVFLAGFTLISAGIANGIILLTLMGGVLVLASAGLFLKAKPWEHAE